MPYHAKLIVSHIAQGVNGEDSSIEGFHNTLSRYVLKGISPIKEQNWSRLVDCVCTHYNLEKNNIL